MKQKNGGPTLDGSATKRLIFELPFIAPYFVAQFKLKTVWKMDDEDLFAAFDDDNGSSAAGPSQEKSTSNEE